MSPHRNCSQFLLLFNSLSLDAPVIAISWQYFVACNLGISLRWFEVLLLFLVTWLAYAADRLLDSLQQGKQKSKLPRHLFAFRHKRSLSILWLNIFLLTSLLALTTIETSILLVAFALAVGVVCYFALCFYFPQFARIIIPREIVVSGVFVIAALFFSVSHIQDKALSETLPAILSLGAILWPLAFLNCLGISCWEQNEDRNAGEATLATTFPALPAYYPVLNAVFACGLLLSFSFSESFSSNPTLIGGTLVSIVLLTGIHFLVSQRKLKPVLADLALLVPWFSCFLF